MTATPRTPMTCDEFDALLPDLVEDALDVVARADADAHAEDCARCRGLLADLRDLRTDAARLPALSPSRDLWDGISARIEAPAVPLRGRVTPGWWQHPGRLAAAAAVLLTVTAGAMWTLGRNGAAPAATAPGVPAQLAAAAGTPAMRVAAGYAAQIAELRALLASRTGTLDSATARVVASNMRVIDDAIDRVRIALDSTPTSLSLSQQLARTYEMKLNTLRQVAAMPTTE